MSVNFSRITSEMRQAAHDVGKFVLKPKHNEQYGHYFSGQGGPQTSRPASVNEGRENNQISQGVTTGLHWTRGSVGMNPSAEARGASTPDELAYVGARAKRGMANMASRTVAGAIVAGISSGIATPLPVRDARKLSQNLSDRDFTKQKAAGMGRAVDYEIASHTIDTLKAFMPRVTTRVKAESAMAQHLLAVNLHAGTEKAQTGDQASYTAQRAIDKLHKPGIMKRFFQGGSTSLSSAAKRDDVKEAKLLKKGVGIAQRAVHDAVNASDEKVRIMGRRLDTANKKLTDATAKRDNATAGTEEWTKLNGKVRDKEKAVTKAQDKLTATQGFNTELKDVAANFSVASFGKFEHLRPAFNRLQAAAQTETPAVEEHVAEDLPQESGLQRTTSGDATVTAGDQNRLKVVNGSDERV